MTSVLSETLEMTPRIRAGSFCGPWRLRARAERDDEKRHGRGGPENVHDASDWSVGRLRGGQARREGPNG